MYFVCPSCDKALRVPAEKLPQRPMRYTCKACGTTSSLQDNLHPDLPARNLCGQAGAGAVEAEPTIGTVYHNVSNLRSDDTPPARFEMHLSVRAGDGTEFQRRFSESRIVVGRKGADLVVNDPLVSRHHVELERVKETVLLKDLESTNGTFLNEKAVTAGVAEPEDVIRVGNTSIQVKVTVR